MQSILQSAPKPVCFSQWQWKDFAWCHTHMVSHEIPMHFLQDVLVSLTQVCLNAGNGIRVAFCVMKIVDMIYLNASKTLSPSLSACLTGQIAGPLAALQSPGLPSLHPSTVPSLRAPTPPAAGF